MVCPDFSIMEETFIDGTLTFQRDTHFSFFAGRYIQKDLNLFHLLVLRFLTALTITMTTPNTMMSAMTLIVPFM